MKCSSSNPARCGRSRRHFLGTTLGAGLAAAVGSVSPSSGSASAYPVPGFLAQGGTLEKIRLGSVSCGGRAGELMSQFTAQKEIRLIAVSDPDSARVDAVQKKYEGVEGYRNLRELLDRGDLDAVLVATCNHWHCLGAILAMQAGCHVYVEKPLSHSQWEGRQTVLAARKYGKVCQVGMQQRSDPMQAEIKAFLHEEKAIGMLRSGRINRYGIRGSIGRLDVPLTPPATVDYNLWLGPAQELPIYRKSFHYDWHWDWNTGSGEMGNWGVHVIDDFRNNVLLDKPTLPLRVMAGGGRVVWNDAGESPNVHFVYYDTGSIPCVLGLSNIPARPGEKSSAGACTGPGSGYVAFGEGGRLEGQRGSAVAFDADGKELRRFRGNGGGDLHAKNFIEAIQTNDPSILRAEVSLGNDSAGWCNLANIAYRCGKAFSDQTADSLNGKTDGRWEELLGQTRRLLADNGIDPAAADSNVWISPMLTLDPATQRFTGDDAERANSFLKREYRKEFEVPDFE